MDADDEQEIRVSERLLGDLVNNDEVEEVASSLNMASLWDLYLSHTLSTWNARTYEFSVVSYLSFLPGRFLRLTFSYRFYSLPQLFRIPCWLLLFGTMSSHSVKLCGCAS